MSEYYAGKLKVVSAIMSKAGLYQKMTNPPCPPLEKGGSRHRQAHLPLFIVTAISFLEGTWHKRPCTCFVLFLAGWLLTISGFVSPAWAEAPAPAAPQASAWSRPGPYEVAVMYYTWQDDRRRREVPVKIYYPAKGPGPFPLVIFSHGLGGSREGYQYLGRHWASHGYVSVHLQHLGSDSAIWEKNLSRLPADRRPANKLENAVNRPLDVAFALDQLAMINQSASPLQGRLDLNRAGVAGHSFGAYTALAAAGQVFTGPGGREISLMEPRLKAAIPMSTPVPRKSPEYLSQAYARVKVPCLHMTGTKDDSPVGETAAPDRRLPFDHLRGSDQYLITFQNGDHMMFSDFPCPFDRMAKDPRLHDLIRLASTAYWEAYLKGDAAARHWLAGGGLAQALAGKAALEMKMKK